jgi:hypothetical protein
LGGNFIGWAPKPVWKLRNREKLLAPVKNRANLTEEKSFVFNEICGMVIPTPLSDDEAPSKKS